MSRIRYCNRFFKTKQAAITFRNTEMNGCGCLYSYAKGSRTKQSYLAEAAMRGMSMDDCNEYPYVIAWNETVD